MCVCLDYACAADSYIHAHDKLFDLLDDWLEITFWLFFPNLFYLLRLEHFVSKVLVC